MRIAFLNPQGNFDSNDSFLTEHPDFGGQLVYVKELCLALADLGVDTDIITRRIDDADWPGFATPTDSYTGYTNNPRIVRIECGGTKFLNKEQLWPHLPEFVDNIVKFYGQHPPDFATAHYADGGYCATLLRQALEINFTFTGHSLGAQKLDKLGMNLENADALQDRFHFSERIAAERYSMQSAHCIVTSTNQERFQQYNHPLYHGTIDVDDDVRFAVIPPGVNTRVFSGNSDAIDDSIHRAIDNKTPNAKEPYVVASSRLDEKKNILGLVKAYAQSPNLQNLARLAIFIRAVENPFKDVSSLPTAERQVLEPVLATIVDANIRDRVDFFDIRSQLELAAAYRYFAQRNSVFALTAFYEPFGLAPIEAAACGLAVVATQQGGPSEIFADGSGLLVDPTDPADIAEKLVECLNNAAHYADRGMERVRTTYTWNKTAERYLAVAIQGIAANIPRNYISLNLNESERIHAYLDNSHSKI